MKLTMTGALRQVWHDISNGENLDTYVAIVVALVLTIASVFGYANTQVLFGGLFATLTVLLFGTLANRRNISQVRQSIGAIAVNRNLLSQLQPSTAHERRLIVGAKRLSVLGTSLFRFLPTYQYEIQEMLSAGGTLRIVLSRPTDAVAQMVHLRSSSGAPADMHRDRIQSMIALVELWKRNIPIAHIELRMIESIAPYGITIIEPKSKAEAPYCLVRLATFRTSSTTAPAINPDYMADRNWFDFYVAQFENFWEAAEEYDLGKPS